ncbi:hypothetical protein ACFQRK_22735 [Parapedobacter sp. GCM10030251]|uniref:hypothetical protein n=1 Tax=Parapedobacter sp. GCM10030251 TaxID=3273419 RepID=UPI00361796EC
MKRRETDSKTDAGYTYADQPTTCPKCGNLTTFVGSFFQPATQWHTCLSRSCRYSFIQVADE